MRTKDFMTGLFIFFLIAFIGSIVLISRKNVGTFKKEKNEYMLQKKIRIEGEFVESFKASGPVHLIKIIPKFFENNPLPDKKNLIGYRTADTSAVFILALKPKDLTIIDSVSVKDFQVKYFSKKELLQTTPVEQLRVITMQTTKNEIEDIVGETLISLDSVR